MGTRNHKSVVDFRGAVKDEMVHLADLCHEWRNILKEKDTETSLTEEIIGDINVAIGE